MSEGTRRRPWHRSPLIRLLVALATAGLLAAFTAAAVGANVFAHFGTQALDNLFTSGERSPEVVVVGIDRESIAEMDAPWPWSREIHADVLRGLTAAGADVVVFDVVFDFPGDGDDAFAAAIRESGRTVLGADATTIVETSGDLRQAQFVRMPIPEFVEGAAAVGHVAVGPDPLDQLDPLDGVRRTIPLVLEQPDRRFLPSLTLAALAVSEGIDPQPVLRPEGVQVGDVVHATEAGRYLRINWAPGLERPSTDPLYLSAVDVVRGDFDPTVVEGAIVFIGAADPLLGDNALTPVAKTGAGAPGVYVHANAASTMLTGHYRAFPVPGETVLVVFVLALLVALTALFAPLTATPIVVVLLAIAYFFGAEFRFEGGQGMDLVYPNLALVFAGISGAGFRYFTEGRERRAVSTLFSQYVPKEVAHQLLAEGRAVDAAEGERLDVTVWFCDLRGFTAIAAVREPAEVRDVLSIFYDYGTRFVLEHGGTLMQYVGDEIFAVFGAPFPHEDHAQRALDAAVAMQLAKPEMDKEMIAKGLPPIEYGIGLNSGPVVAAHMGGGLRKQYGVIGDTVNVGARICGLAQVGEVALPEMVRRRLTREPELERLGDVELKGVSEDPKVSRVKLPGLPPVSERISRSEEKSKVIGGSTEDEETPATESAETAGSTGGSSDTDEEVSGESPIGTPK